MKEKEDTLLDLLDKQEERKEERIVVPKTDFDPVRKIAAIYSRSNSRYDISNLEGEFSDVITAYYLVDSVSEDEANSYLTKTNGLRKLIINNVSKELTEHKNTYNPAYSLERLTLLLANDIYSDVFNILGENLYMKKQRLTQATKQPKEEAKENYQDLLTQYATQDINLILAAKATLPLFENLEQRLPYVSSTKELRHLIVLNLFRKLMKDKETLGLIDEPLNDTRYTPKDLLIHAALRINQDFMKEIEKISGKGE